MNNLLKIGGIVVGALILAGIGATMGVMASGQAVAAAPQSGTFGYGPGMMGGYNGGYSGYGGMMGGYRNGDRSYGGMMGGYAPNADSASASQTQRLTTEQAIASVQSYLKAYGNSNLKLAEVMQFNNQFYAEVREKDTGIGAFELLVDLYTGAIHPEPGPNMMWNTKYSMMGGNGPMGGGMMGGGPGGWQGGSASGPMTVTEDQAKTLAQSYLDTAMPGVKVGHEADKFYGYYTIHTERDGKVIGMLSVNGYSGAVWLHTWHGTFVDMTEVED